MMKKLLFLLLLLITQTYAFTQNNMEAVYLKNGDEVRGSIVGIMPAKSVTIAAVEGDTFVYDLTKVDKITRESIFSSEDKEDRSSYIAPEKGYRFLLSLDLMAGKMSGLKWTTVHGVQINKNIFLGAGTGFCVADDYYGLHMSVPLFLDFRSDFLEERITPFVEARVGAVCALEGSSGFYGDFSFGSRMRRFSISAGVETLPGEDEDYIQYRDHLYYRYETVTYKKQSYNFYIRFSIEF